MATVEPAPPSREIIDNCTQALFKPMALCAALRLDVFTTLADGPKTAAEIARALDLDAGRLELLLYQLVLATLLTFDGERFANGDVAEYYLVQGRPEYTGRIHELWSEMWGAMFRTAESIRAKAPVAKLDFAAMTEEELSGFFRGIHRGAFSLGRVLAKEPALADARRVVDVGGGSGGASIALCQAHPELAATVVELPPVVPIAQRFVAEAGLQQQITVTAADVTEAPLDGAFDVALARALFQVLSDDQARRAAKHIAAALRPGGQLYIAGHVCDDSRLAPEGCVGMNLVLLNLYDDGQAYTERQYRDWLASAGFSDVARRPLDGGLSLITAKKR